VILFVLIVITISAAAAMFYTGVITSSIFSLLGVSFLSYWAGAGLKGSLYGTNGQRLAGIVGASVFMSLAYLSSKYYPFAVVIFDIYIGGGIWSMIVFSLMFLAVSRKDTI
jgi:hypothetical protein